LLKTEVKKITIAHSPDADDAFMFYALSKGIIKSDKFNFVHTLKDIQTLNTEADSLIYDVQAISFFAYPNIQDKYQLMSCGGSLGNGYGPMVISKEKITTDEISALKGKTIAIPGEKTTAFLLLKLFLKDFTPVVVPFDEIIDTVKAGKYDFGLIIHEGQLSYEKHGLHKVVDLGEWWLGKTNLPVPLGGNVIKRSLPEDEKKEINSLIKQSIEYGINNQSSVVPEVSNYARELESSNELVTKFVSMYVNDFTVDYGISGKLGIKKLYELALKEGLIKEIPVLDFIDS
jgi:1,4-dihydroxy-6-naphthoate synthase